MLKVLGVSAPHYERKPSKSKSTSLNSRDPFSLYNAFRVCAEHAQGHDEYWNKSNWNTQEGRDDSIILMEYFFNDKHIFIDMLDKVKPNLLLIGAMTLSFIGAIEIAKIAKEKYGNDIFIVLGGKHSTETIFCKDTSIEQLKNSPIKLMQSSQIPRVFDMVISGDGEEIIWQIGRAVGYTMSEGLALDNVYKYEGLKDAKGNWVLSWLDNRDEIQALKSTCGDIDYDLLIPTINLFKTTSQFTVFDADLTAHTMSYISPGCVFNCDYCSECSTINGRMRQKETAHNRLYRSFQDIIDVGERKYSSKKMSAFVEDSILLGGFSDLIIRFTELLSSNPIDITWGCQFTIDKLLEKEIQNSVRKLSSLGLSYIFVGLETSDESIASNLSKSTQKNGNNWMHRNEEVIQFLNSLGIGYGVSILLGLGESQESRIQLMKTVGMWKEKYSIPNVVSMNLAVQHPLRKFDFYDYIEWGTPADSEYLKLFTVIFGEASEKYHLPHVLLPSIDELNELRVLYESLNETTPCSRDRDVSAQRNAPEGRGIEPIESKTLVLHQ